jgi:Type II secretion system (T2SS), protein E, N-terminal domain
MPARLAQYLIARGLVSAEQAEEILGTLAREGGALDTALLEHKLISEAQLLEALAEVSGQPSVNLADFEINHAVSSLVPAKIAERLGVTPLSIEGGILHVACIYPVPARELYEVGFLLGKKLEVWVALDVRVRQWLNGLYGLPLNRRYTELINALRPDPAELTSPGVQDLTLEEALSQDVVERLATSVIGEPIPLHAKKSDGREPLAKGSSRIQGDAPKYDEVSDWSLQQGREALKLAGGNPEAALEVALSFAEHTFEFSAFFAIHHGLALGRNVRAPGWTSEDIQKISLPLDVFSVFRTVMLSRGSYVGPPPPDAFTGFFLQKLGRTPRIIFVFPIESRARVNLMLYGDGGSEPISQRKLSDYLLFCQSLPTALSRLARPNETRLATRISNRPRAHEQDFPDLFAQLTGPDVDERAVAMERLASAPPLFAPKLIAQFPGPTSWSRGVVSSLPDASELGPVPAAIVQMGAAGAAALAPLLDSVQLDVRYWAVLTAGNFPAADFIDGLRRALFDPNPDVASAARAAAKNFRSLPQFELVLRDLRRDLTTREGHRRARAAQALGVLHDREVIDGLIGLVGSDDLECAQAAAQALTEITKASFGTNARHWMVWWAENRDRDPHQWLLAGLRHQSLEIRTRSVEELQRLFGTAADSFGYWPEAPEAERETAVRRWEANVKALSGPLKTHA